MTPAILRTVFPSSTPRYLAQLQRSMIEPALLGYQFYLSYSIAVLDLVTGKNSAKKGA